MASALLWPTGPLLTAGAGAGGLRPGISGGVGAECLGLAGIPGSGGGGEAGLGARGGAAEQRRVWSS